MYIGSVNVLLALVECNPEYAIQGGILQVTEYFGSSIAMLECNSQYLLSGDPKHVCDENRIWQGNGTCGKLST